MEWQNWTRYAINNKEKPEQNLINQRNWSKFSYLIFIKQNTPKYYNLKKFLLPVEILHQNILNFIDSLLVKRRKSKIKVKRWNLQLKQIVLLYSTFSENCTFFTIACSNGVTLFTMFLRTARVLCQFQQKKQPQLHKRAQCTKCQWRRFVMRNILFDRFDCVMQIDNDIIPWCCLGTFRAFNHHRDGIFIHFSTKWSLFSHITLQSEWQSGKHETSPLGRGIKKTIRRSIVPVKILSRFFFIHAITSNVPPNRFNEKVTLLQYNFTKCVYLRYGRVERSWEWMVLTQRLCIM